MFLQTDTYFPVFLGGRNVPMIALNTNVTQRGFVEQKGSLKKELLFTIKGGLCTYMKGI